MSEIIREGSMVTVKPNRDIVASMVEEFKKEMRDLLTEDQVELTVDLKGVEMIDSMGIGVLIAAHNSLQKKGSTLHLINASDDILNLFKTMRLNQHFDIQT